MDAVEFLRDFRRMCSRYRSTCTVCTGCELEDAQCRPTEKDFDPKKVIRVVEEWAKEHPVKTRLSETKKLFPDIPLLYYYPLGCVKMYDKNAECTGICSACQRDFWHEQIEENEKNEEKEE